MRPHHFPINQDLPAIMKKLALALLLPAILLTACAGSAKPAGKITLANETWGYYQQYLRAIQPNKPGAFAVSLDGRSAFYYYCEDVVCMSGSGYKHNALKGCKSYGKECVIFAYRDDILVSYEIEK